MPFRTDRVRYAATKTRGNARTKAPRPENPDDETFPAVLRRRSACGGRARLKFEEGEICNFERVFPAAFASFSGVEPGSRSEMCIRDRLMSGPREIVRSKCAIIVSIGIELSVKPIIEHIKGTSEFFSCAAGTSPNP